MNFMPHWNWLRGARPAHAKEVRDAADMGTAFGLDASLIDDVPDPFPGKPPTENDALRLSHRTGLPRRD